MARDYRSADVFSPGTRPLPFWLWLFAAVAISGFVGLIYYLDQYEKSKSGAHTATAESTASSSTKNGKDQDKETHFDFYKLLPKISVDVPKSDVQEKQQKQPAGSHQETQKASPAFNYILQVGSFKDFHEADRLKARLAFLGIEVKIEKVTLNEGDVWNRVRVGPLQSEREMNKVRSQLRNQQIEPIVLKVKG